MIVGGALGGAKTVGGTTTMMALSDTPRAVASTLVSEVVVSAGAALAVLVTVIVASTVLVETVTVTLEASMLSAAATAEVLTTGALTNAVEELLSCCVAVKVAVCCSSLRRSCREFSPELATTLHSLTGASPHISACNALAICASVIPLGTTVDTSVFSEISTSAVLSELADAWLMVEAISATL